MSQGLKQVKPSCAGGEEYAEHFTEDPVNYPDYEVIDLEPPTTSFKSVSIPGICDDDSFKGPTNTEFENAVPPLQGLLPTPEIKNLLWLEWVEAKNEFSEYIEEDEVGLVHFVQRNKRWTEEQLRKYKSYLFDGTLQDVNRPYGISNNIYVQRMGLIKQTFSSPFKRESSVNVSLRSSEEKEVIDLKACSPESEYDDTFNEDIRRIVFDPKPLFPKSFQKEEEEEDDYDYSTRDADDHFKEEDKSAMTSEFQTGEEYEVEKTVDLSSFYSEEDTKDARKDNLGETTERIADRKETDVRKDEDKQRDSERSKKIGSHEERKSHNSHKHSHHEKDKERSKRRSSSSKSHKSNDRHSHKNEKSHSKTEKIKDNSDKRDRSRSKDDSRKSDSSVVTSTPKSHASLPKQRIARVTENDRKRLLETVKDKPPEKAVEISPSSARVKKKVIPTKKIEEVPLSLQTTPSILDLLPKETAPVIVPIKPKKKETRVIIPQVSPSVAKPSRKPTTEKPETSSNVEDKLKLVESLKSKLPSVKIPLRKGVTRTVHKASARKETTEQAQEVPKHDATDTPIDDFVIGDDHNLSSMILPLAENPEDILTNESGELYLLQDDFIEEALGNELEGEAPATPVNPEKIANFPTKDELLSNKTVICNLKLPEYLKPKIKLEKTPIIPGMNRYTIQMLDLIKSQAKKLRRRKKTSSVSCAAVGQNEAEREAVQKSPKVIVDVIQTHSDEPNVENAIPEPPVLVIPGFQSASQKFASQQMDEFDKLFS